MWNSLGFRESPYNTNPLLPRREDIDLLVGRDAEATELCTQLGTASSGVLILSGTPGVGKTSFFNIQQYRLENELAPFGPKILAARALCPVQPTDDLRKLALRAVDSLYRSVDAWCSENGRPVPKQTKEIGAWISGAGTSGFSLGVSILGCGGSFGRTAQLPKASDASFEAVADALAAISSEVVASLGFEASIVALDNLENFSDEQMASMLISYRDTLFSIPNVWWVLIGQSGLGSLIQSLDPRVFERTTGSGIEIKPVQIEELHEAIAIRVSKFHRSKGGKSPLTEETHKRLYEASFGEMRFVFKYSNSICAKFVEKMRDQVLNTPDMKAKQSKPEFKKSFESALNSFIGQMLINSQLSHQRAASYLRAIVEGELKGFYLKPKELEVLEAIGKAGQARASDFKAFPVRSMQDFSSNYLTKLHDQNLLTRKQEGRAVNYRLRGIAQLSHAFGILASPPK
jgi:Cdc6-like AAA superfamily ATPase